MIDHDSGIAHLTYRYLVAFAVAAAFLVVLGSIQPDANSDRLTDDAGAVYMPLAGQASGPEPVVPDSPYATGASTIAANSNVVAAALASGIALYTTQDGAPHFLGRSESRAAAVTALAVEGTLLFSAERELTGGSLVVYDWTDAANVLDVTTLSLSSPPSSMAGPLANRLFIGSDNGDITIVDTSQAPLLTVLGTFVVDGPVPALGLDPATPSTLYVAVNNVAASTESQLRKYDVSVPTAPLLQGTVALPAPGTAIDPRSGLAAVGTVSAGVLLVDLSALQILGTAPMTGMVADARISGSTLLVSDSHYTPFGEPDAIGIRAFDVSNPSAPTALGSVAIARQAGEFAAAGDYLYVATPLGVAAVNVSSPSQLSLVGDADDWRQWVESGAFVDTDYGLVADVFGRLGNVTLASGSHTVVTDTQSAVYAIETVTDTGYVLGDNFLLTLDVSTPSQPSVVGAVEDLLQMGDPSGGSVVVQDDVAFAGGMWGLSAVDVSSPVAPSPFGEFVDVWGVRDMSVYSAELAIATENSWALRAISATAPLSSPVLAHVDLPGTRALVRSGSHVFVGGLGFLKVYDVTGTPSLTASLALDGMVADMALVQSVLYVAYHDRPMHLLDVQSPAAPTILGSVGAVPYAKGLALNGPRLLILGGNYLAVIDVANPVQPVLNWRRLLPG